VCRVELETAASRHPSRDATNVDRVAPPVTADGRSGATPSYRSGRRPANPTLGRNARGVNRPGHWTGTIAPPCNTCVGVNRFARGLRACKSGKIICIRCHTGSSFLSIGECLCM